MKAIIFSKDRAMQLDLLLRSIKMYAPIFDEIEVIYTYTSDLHKQAYKNIKGCTLTYEQSFELDTKNAINESHKYTCFFVDDDVFYKKADSFEFDGVCYSFRLGDNVKNPIHFNYPYSLDGHIYKTDHIKRLIYSIKFNNPNTLEGTLHNRFKGGNISYDSQKLIGVPVNKVSVNSTCKAGNIDVNMLAKKFIEGYIIDMDNLNIGTPDDVHKELDFKFIKC